MRLSLLLPIVILGASAAGAAVLMKTRPQSEPIAREEKVWPVQTVTVQRADNAPTLLLYGRVETPRTAHITAALSADVVAVEVLEGDRVEAGQMLVTLDDREARLLLRQRQAELDEIEAQVELEEQAHRNNLEALERESRVLELARRAVARAENLARTNVGSRSQLDSARQEEEQRSMAVDARRTAIEGHASRMAQLRARLARAEALRDRAELDVRRSQVRAPFSGRVSAVSVSTGDRVQPGAGLLSLFDDQALELRAQVPTGQIPRLRAALSSGTPVPASGTVGGEPVSAVLNRLGAEVTRGSGGVDALFDVTAGSAVLPLGLTVEVHVRLGAVSDSIALPPQALYGADHVYRLHEGRMQRVRVERIGDTRANDGTRVLLRSDTLASGDQVIVTQLPNAVDGLRVQVSGG